MVYTKHQVAVMKTVKDLIKRGATEILIKKHVFGFGPIIVRANQWTKTLIGVIEVLESKIIEVTAAQDIYETDLVYLDDDGKTHLVDNKHHIERIWDE